MLRILNYLAMNSPAFSLGVFHSIRLRRVSPALALEAFVSLDVQQLNLEV